MVFRNRELTLWFQGSQEHLMTFSGGMDVLTWGVMLSLLPPVLAFAQGQTTAGSPQSCQTAAACRLRAGACLF